ncbi:DUF3800 domain-containing protein [Pontibacillus salipaludis]|uniref:DUF3800 domain-containing protein n=1 Tax=Pontibacillus salipaludis TaxID=1697394 RepID=A0ABQ1QJ82_9BACI|nr:DUF3800 domain-containing protein [Pontibacillus salipaludis]GGD28954.1 hypothetical protein GCM10011389_40670 [Pontibacillus salipaludis]
MERYHLYLDESETHYNGSNRVFCLAGIIVKEKDVPELESSLDSLKRDIWKDQPNPTSLILHEKEVKEVEKSRINVRKAKPEYRIFRRNGAVRKLYKGLENIVEDTSCTVVGAVIKMDDLSSYYKEDISSHNYLIAMQMILENYCHFLESVQGHGKVFYESRDLDPNAKVRMHYHHVKAMGSMYVNAFAMQKHLGEIEFPDKTENNAGLQVADFVPNTFARKAAGFKKHKFSISDVTRKSRYDGGLQKRERFGVKVMP